MSPGLSLPPKGCSKEEVLAAMRAAITPNTILMAASAPAYPHGVVDPIAKLAAVAQEHGLLFSAVLMAGFYPITRERHARIRKLLARRKARVEG